MKKIWREGKYILPIIVLPSIVLISFYGRGAWTFFAGIFAFVFIPFIELFFTGTTENLTEEEEKNERAKRYYDILLYITVPMQFVLLSIYLWQITHVSLAWYELVGMTWSAMLLCGVIGINVGHELGHRSKQYEQVMAKALLMSSLYMHFFIEHNRGHHKNVASPLDPATSKLNEPLYSFYFRSVCGGWWNAWHLEENRLRKQNLSFWNPLYNEMLRFQIIQIALCVGIFMAFGWIGLLGFLAAATGGFLLLETVNYIEHYGMLRTEVSPGRYERVRPQHSWNSNHELGRILLFELTRHSDHHYNAGRKYQILRHFENAPQMPTGYPGMMLVSLVPPLWYKVMNQRAIHHLESLKLLQAETNVMQKQVPA